MREAENKVRIEGILLENDIKSGSYVNKDTNKTVEFIGGKITIKVPGVEVSDITKDLEIPVHVFANKYKKDGSENAIYKNLENIMNNYVSVAACGDEAKADVIRINGAKITTNEYYNRSGQFVSFPRITTNFISKAKKEEFAPVAEFNAQMVVADKIREVDKDGVETGRLKIKGIIPGYNDAISIVDFFAVNPKAINVIETNWNKGDTVQFFGKLNFTSTTETTTVEADFGDPQTKTRTITVSELFITGGAAAPLDGEFAYDIEEVNKAVAVYKANIEAKKNQGKTEQKTAPAKKSVDLGF